MDFADLFLCRIFCLEANYHYTTRYMTLGPKFYRPVVWSIFHHPSKQFWVLLSQNLSFFKGNLSRQVPCSRKFKMSQKKRPVQKTPPVILDTPSKKTQKNKLKLKILSFCSWRHILGGRTTYNLWKKY